MSKIELAREIAKRSPARFVEIRERRPRSGDATLLLRAKQQERRSAVLEGELMRLLELWESR